MSSNKNTAPHSFVYKSLGVLSKMVLTITSWPFCVLPSPPLLHSTSKAASDLLDLQPAFQQALPLSSGLPAASTWAGEISWLGLGSPAN